MTTCRLITSRLANCRLITTRLRKRHGTVATRIIRLEGDMAFGEVTVGESSAATLTIYNDGNASLHVSDITLPTGFGREIAGDGSFDVAAGDSEVVTITFEPAEATEYSGNIEVVADETSGTDTIAASGTGVAAAVPQDPVSIERPGTNPSYQWIVGGTGWEGNYASLGKYGTTGYCSVQLFVCSIPAGAVITKATVTGKSKNSHTGAGCKVNCYFNTAINPSFPANAAAAEALALTEPVAWTISANWTNGLNYTSPDLKTILQTIVDADGYAAGQNILFVTRDNGSDTDGYRLWDGLLTMTLYIEYSIYE